MKIALSILLILFAQVAWAQLSDDMDSVEKKASNKADSLHAWICSRCEHPEMPSELGSFYESSEDLFLSLLSDLNIQDFSVRGLSFNRRKILVNGLEWNSPEDQSISFDDLMPLFGNAQINTIDGLSIQTFSCGGVDGISEFKINPLLVQKSYEVGYRISNTNTKNLLRMHYHSGLLKGLWAVDFSYTQKWSKEGYTPGTFLDARSFVVSVGKELSPKQSIVLTSFGNHFERGLSSPITKETAQLANDFKYNPDWGYQEGKGRNAHTEKAFQPAVILNYHLLLSTQTRLSAALSFQSGRKSYSVLDWYHAYNPQPNYYKNLPSYYYLQGGDFNDYVGNFLTHSWQEAPYQIGWTAIYDVNRVNAMSANGASLPALYGFSEDVSRPSVFRMSLLFKSNPDEHWQITGGTSLSAVKTENFRKLTDLLGGNYFVNLNQFADRSQGQPLYWAQYDLLDPDRRVRQGQKYFYDYLAQSKNGNVWTTSLLKTRQFQITLSASADIATYQRTGFYKNGIFDKDSYGHSGWKTFLTYQSKIGFQYTFQPNNQVSVMMLSETNPPDFEHTFFDPRIRNTIIEGVSPEQLNAVELSCKMRRKKWQMDITLFASEIKNQTDVMQFYNDDYRTYVHLILNDVSTAQRGIEAALSIYPTTFLKINLLVALSQSFYDSRPTITLLRDNDTTLILGKQTVYWKNNYAITGPQSVFGLSLNFHHSRWGALNISGVWQNRNYVSLNPSRLTEAAVYLLSESSDKRAAIVDQEKLPPFFLLNVDFEKSIRFQKSTSGFLRKSSWYFTAGIRNILNRQGYIRYGAEQLRFDFNQQNPDLFPNKYTYGLGRTFFIGLKYKM